ncbi:3-oxoacid CoA-transferase, A subunit [Clostridiales bacterium KA00134]|nr:3-oxoacid CoA-transferase, A subunit [Clostridiales bacterium KA00134]
MLIIAYAKGVKKLNKLIGLQEAVKKIKNGDVVMVGGFLGCGGPNMILDYIADNTDLKDLTLICNDTAFPEVGVGKMVVKKMFKKIIASHIGTNKETGRQMSEEETEVVLVPQGTLAEQVRSGGYGLGGVLTKTGLGSKEIEEGKKIIEIDGEKWLLEKPLKADVALLNCAKADKFGNLEFHGSTQNFNTLMAFAAETVIVQADKVVEIGELNPDNIRVPGVLVTDIVDGGKING